jgi:hypothetical protein
MSTKNKPVFRIQFRHRDQLIDLYAHGVSQSSMMGFVEISGLIFNKKTDVLIDPSEEKIKAEFGGVKSTYIPVHTIIRIDEVEKTGSNKIRPLSNKESQGSSIAPFPSSSSPGNTQGN